MLNGIVGPEASGAACTLGFGAEGFVGESWGISDFWPDTGVEGKMDRSLVVPFIRIK